MRKMDVALDRLTLYEQVVAIGDTSEPNSVQNLTKSTEIAGAHLFQLIHSLCIMIQIKADCFQEN